MARRKKEQRIVQKSWSEMTLQELFHTFETGKDGLSERAAAGRRKEYGDNVLPEERRRGGARVLLRQFENPLILVLVGATAVTILLRDYTDAMVIGVAIFLNVIIGFIQEYKAERSLAALKRFLEPEALVLREGREHTILARHIVPGDLLVLRTGVTVPADARLVESIELEANEAVLTGEAYPVTKDGGMLKPLREMRRGVADQKNMVFAGTVITQGIGRALVVATGATTEFGRIAALLQTVPDDTTPLQEKLARLSRGIAAFVLIVAASVFVLGVVLGKSMLEMFTMAVALAVSAIPEGLVVAVTAILAIGMQRILKRGALVRTLVAAETLGSTTVICTDKTGTLTEGVMRMTRLVTETGETAIDHGNVIDPLARQCLEIAALANTVVVEKTADDPDAWELVGSPTEVALVRGAAHGGVHRTVLLVDHPLRDLVPFTATRKYVMTLHGMGVETRLNASGAAERLLARATQLLTVRGARSLTTALRQRWEEKILAYAREGYRVIGLAFRQGDGMRVCAKIPDCEGALTFAGIALLEDPIRQDVPEVIRESRAAGIHTVMITGDHAATATHVAERLGLDGGMEQQCDGAALDALGDDALRAHVADITVYSRVTPEHKLRIVRAWQAEGAVVAVTGDGVNDAPALKQADIGVAVGSGTDVAKEASDLVLLNNSFATIVHAIREGRIIYDNIRKVALYLLSDSFSEIILVVGALVLGIPLPLLAAQILWINLVTDGFPSIALTVDPATRDVMHALPVERSRPIIGWNRTMLIVLVSIVTGVGNLLLFQWWYAVTGDLDRARSLVFVSLSIDSLVYIFSIRTLRLPLWRVPPWSNPWLLLGVVGGAVLTLAAVTLPFLRTILRTTPLTTEEWGIVGLVALAVMVLIEVSKVGYRIISNHKEKSEIRNLKSESNPKSE